MDVVGLGALNLDFICQVSFDDLPMVEKGTERKITTGELSLINKFLKDKNKSIIKSGGGSAANTIYLLSKMGVSCGFIGKVGKDKEGDFLLQNLKEAKVDTSQIIREGKTGICFILVDKKGERSVLIVPGTNDTLTAHQIDVTYINRAKILHTASFVGKVSFQTQKEIISKTKIPLSFDPGQPHASKGLDELLPILKKTFILFSTHKEIELITSQNFKEGARKIIRNGTKIVVCKLGEKGSWIISLKEELFIPAQKIKSIDTTGAGDVYAAGFLTGILYNLSHAECGKLGTYAAGESITGFGRLNYPGKNFLEGFLQKVGVKNVF